MEVEELLKLFDYFWFERVISFTPKYEAPSPTAMLMLQRLDESEESKISGVKNLQIRSLSDRCLGVNISNYRKEAAASKKSVIIKPTLKKILSGKEVVEFSREVEEQENAEKSRTEKQYCSRKKKGRKGISRSLSALEFEELKGFMDLGFVFTEEDKNPSVISIIPGLQKWGKMVVDDDDKVGEKGEISRPYLSEAWGVVNKRRGDDNFLMNWKIPPLQNEISMKDHLKIWAHTVASNVR